MENTLIFLQSLLKTAAGIPFAQIPFTESALQNFLQGYSRLTPLLQDYHNLWNRLLHFPVQSRTVFEFRLPGDGLFLLYIHQEGGCILCFGPVQTSFTAQESQIAYQNLSVVDRDVLFQTSQLIVEKLTGNAHLQSVLCADTLHAPDKDFIHRYFIPEEDIVHIRQVEQRYEHSAALTDAVQQGNLSLALHLVQNYNPGTQTTVRNTNPLRNAQNYCIVLNTQLRHAMEKTGIHPYQVDKLSNEVGMEIEQLKRLERLSDFFTSVIRRYCRLVQEHNYPNLKPLTNLAVTYIKEHLADNLTVKDTAKALTVNANYLSTLFHKDMGMTFIDFVNRERTAQAASLLRHTNLQIQQIAATVGYNNTSYFAKQFVRFQGVSPSRYRR